MNCGVVEKSTVYSGSCDLAPHSEVHVHVHIVTVLYTPFVEAP